MTTKSITIQVNFIGKIWMPAATCAMSFSIGDFDNSCFSEPWDLSDDAQCKEFVEHFLYGSKSGDFQSVTDYEAIRTIKTVRSKLHATLTVSKDTVIHAWENEDNECVYCDCMS